MSGNRGSRTGATAEFLPTSAIVPCAAHQPRKALNPAVVRQLVDELRDGGRIRSPLLVSPMPHGDGFLLVDGFHRYEAATIAGAASVPVEIVPDFVMAWEMTADRNAHGARWTTSDAKRHAAQGIREGAFRNADGTPWPLSIIAKHFGRFGLKRMALTRFLDREAAAGDEQLREFLAASRAAHDKQNRSVEIAVPVEELAARAKAKRRDAALTHLKSAARLLRGLSATEVAEEVSRWQALLIDSEQAATLDF